MNLFNACEKFGNLDKTPHIARLSNNYDHPKPTILARLWSDVTALHQLRLKD